MGRTIYGDFYLYREGMRTMWELGSGLSFPLNQFLRWSISINLFRVRLKFLTEEESYQSNKHAKVQAPRADWKSSLSAFFQAQNQQARGGSGWPGQSCAGGAGWAAPAPAVPGALVVHWRQGSPGSWFVWCLYTGLPVGNGGWPALGLRKCGVNCRNCSVPRCSLHIALGVSDTISFVLDDPA